MRSHADKKTTQKKENVQIVLFLDLFNRFMMAFYVLECIRTNNKKGNGMKHEKMAQQFHGTASRGIRAVFFIFDIFHARSDVTDLSEGRSNL